MTIRSPSGVPRRISLLALALVVGLLLAVVALRSGVAITPSSSGVDPFVNGVLLPTTSTVAPSSQVVAPSASGATPFVNGVLRPAASTVTPTSQVVTPSGGVATPYLNGVLRATSGTVAPTAQAITPSTTVVTPETDTATASSQTLTPSSFAVGGLVSGAAAGSSSQTLTPSSFVVSGTTSGGAASSSSQTLTPSSFNVSGITAGLPAGSSAQSVTPSSFAIDGVTAGLGAESSAASVTPSSFNVEGVRAGLPAASSVQTVAPSSFTVTAISATGASASTAAVTPSSQVLSPSSASVETRVNGVIPQTTQGLGATSEAVDPSCLLSNPYVDGSLESFAGIVVPGASGSPAAPPQLADGDGICVGAGFQPPKTGGNDNCPDTPNVSQDDFDGDAIPGVQPKRGSALGNAFGGDACDADDDNDLVADVDEPPCGGDPLDLSVPRVRPERVDDGFVGITDDLDADVDEALPPGAGAFDCDGDGYTGDAEDHVYSYIGQLDGDQKTCQEYDTNFTAVDPNQTAATPSLRWPSDFNASAFPLDSFNKITILDLTSFLAPVRYFGTNLGTNPGDVRWDLTPGPGIFPKDINIQDLTALLAGSSGSPPMLGGAKALGGPVCPWAP